MRFYTNSLNKINKTLDEKTVYDFLSSFEIGSANNAVKIDSVNGKSYVLNQTAKIDQETTTISGITFTNNNDGSFTLNGIATEDIDKNFEFTDRTVYTTHKYLLKGCPVGGSATTYALKMLRLDSLDTGNGVIANASSDGASRLNIVVKSGTTLSNLVFKPQLFDLTLMFGSGKEPTTIADFNKLFPNDYYAYNFGTLISSKPKTYKITGYNLLSLDRTLGEGGDFNKKSARVWNESKYYLGFTKNNYYIKSSITSFSISENSVSFINTEAGYGVAFPIRVLPNTKYTFSYNSDSTNAKISASFYKENGELISYIQTPTFTTPDNCYWAVIILTNRELNTLITFTNICFHLTWSGSKTGYEPYYSKTYELPNVELKSAGNTSDILTSDGTLIKNIGVVDLGSLTWIYDSTNAVFHSDNLTQMITQGEIICQKYVTVKKYPSNIGDKEISSQRFYTRNNIIIKDTAFTDAATFKTSLSGVLLYYELAIPTEEKTKKIDTVAYVNDQFTVEQDSQNAPTKITFRYGKTRLVPIDLKIGPNTKIKEI